MDYLQGHAIAIMEVKGLTAVEPEFLETRTVLANGLKQILRGSTDK